MGSRRSTPTLPVAAAVVSDAVMQNLLNVDAAEWVDAVVGQEDFMKSYGSHMPHSMWDEHDDLARRIDDQMTLVP